MKEYRQHFNLLLNKLKNNENFAFSRFSDGEMRIMKNLRTEIGSDYYYIGENKFGGSYYPEDYKEFLPEKHQETREWLMNAYKHLQDNYYVGLSCRCCVGISDFKEMLSWYDGDINSDNLTWANLWVNGNYPLFKEEMIPEFSNKKIVYTLNENGNIDGLPFNIVKDFRVGNNCMVNNVNLVDEMGEWIEKNNIEDHVFLFSAASLSNILIYELYKKYPKNTYIDIGTTLNIYLGMKGVRTYLLGGDKKICIW